MLLTTLNLLQDELRGIDSALTNHRHEVYVMEGIRAPPQSHRVIHRGMSARTGRVALVGLGELRDEENPAEGLELTSQFSLRSNVPASRGIEKT
jgi:hypothetical protein